MNTLKEWEEYIEDYTRKLEERQRKQKKEGVQILTLHGAKGLEFDRVYILNVNEGSIPYRKAVLARRWRRNGGCFMWDDRARKFLTLCYVKKQYEKEREPSRFLKEAGL